VLGRRPPALNMATIRVKTKSILEMEGVLKAPEGMVITVEEMNAWR